MRVLPSKTVAERRMFSVDFGDILPWAPTITFARMRVSVFSGTDGTPQQVFWKVISITGTVVIFQVRLGTPGVIYSLKCEVEVNGKWYDRDVKLAILTDFADVSGLYPFTQIFTSGPYAIEWFDEVNVDLAVVSGILDTLLVEAEMEGDDVNVTFAAVSGALFASQPPEIIDNVNVTLTPMSGTIKVPPNGTIVDRVDVTMFPQVGTLKPGPQGLMSDEIDVTMIPMSGSLL